MWPHPARNCSAWLATVRYCCSSPPHAYLPGMTTRHMHRAAPHTLIVRMMMSTIQNTSYAFTTFRQYNKLSTTVWVGLSSKAYKSLMPPIAHSIRLLRLSCIAQSAAVVNACWVFSPIVSMCSQKAHVQLYKGFLDRYGQCVFRRAGEHPPNLQKIYPAQAKRVRKAPQRYSGEEASTPCLHPRHAGEARPAPQPHSYSGVLLSINLLFENLLQTRLP